MAEILVCVEILLEGEAGVEGVIFFNFFLLWMEFPRHSIACGHL